MDADQDYFNLMSCIALLEQHSKIHYFSLSLTISAIVLVIINAPDSSFFLLSLCSSLVLIGAIELMCAVRIGFDKNLLTLVSIEMNSKKNTTTDPLLVLDQALEQLKLIPSNKKYRSLNERLLGCILLFKKQAASVSVQLILMMIILIMK